jgi:formamidopyrimidine-DNA glycosylase
MPELPDLQVFSRNLTKVLKGKKLVKLNVIQAKKLNVTEHELCDALVGQELKQVVRSGKQMHFQFNNGNVLGIHLMLHGKMVWFDGDNDQKYTIVELYFEGGKGLAITDFQKQATPTLNPPEADAPDALEANLAFWKTTLSNSHAAVKTILLNQQVIRGIGNAYADEILYDAKLSPFSIANKIPEKNIKALAKSVSKVLKNAEAEIQKNDPERISGEYRDFLLVHRPKQKVTASGAVIEQKPIASRKTYYTNEQELFN